VKLKSKLNEPKVNEEPIDEGPTEFDEFNDKGTVTELNLMEFNG
jgi:hypothetical protein